MAYLYGFFNDTVYRMSTKKNVEQKVIEPFKSGTYIREDVSTRSITNCVKINTMDFYKEEANEMLYSKLIEFVKKSKVKGIDTLFYSLTIGLDYQITDNTGAVIDGGVRYIQTDAEEVNILLDPDPMTNALPYRKAEYLKKKFAISRINGSRYGVMDSMPKGIVFGINAIVVYANLTDAGSEYYIRNLGPSAQDTTFCYGSGTINSIKNHSIVLLDTSRLGIEIPRERLTYVPDTIYVSVEALLNQFCSVSDDSELWEVVENNGGQESNAPSEFDFPTGPNGSVFDPVVNRPPCHGNYPVPPMRPPHGNGWNPAPPCHPPVAPPPMKPLEPSKPIRPILPNDKWDPEDTIVPKPDLNQDHGDFNELEWCFCLPTDPSVKFLVVADDISDSDFDATSMVKISDVLPYVTDIKVGDHVKQMDALYY